MDRASLEQASREQLYALIGEQEATIARLGVLVEQLQARVAELEARLGGPPSGKSVPAFVKASRKKVEPAKPRKGRSQAFVRRREEPTRQVSHALERCQECGTRLFGGSVKRKRQVLHIPLVPVEVVEHLYIERCCPVCGKRNVPKVELGAQVVGKNRLSSSTMAMVASLRELGRLPLEKIQWLLATFHKLKLSLGELVRVLDTVAGRAKSAMHELREQVRGSVHVHADETGWREDGTNGYLWSFSNGSVHYLLQRQSRASEVVREVLGEQFSGVLVSDFYSAYNFLDCPHQRCWVHLLRDVHELVERHPNCEPLSQWARAVNEVYLEAKATSQRVKLLSKAERVLARQALEERLLSLATPYLKADVPQRVLCQRIDRFLAELFTFVELAIVPSDNNAAERALRPQVVARKISGGTRSSKGSQTKTTLASIFSTWQLQGLDPFLACQNLLNSP
jgi:transposase